MSPGKRSRPALCALRDLRLGHFAHGGWGFDEIVSRESYLAGVMRNGRAANSAPGSGLLLAGGPADMIVLDLDRLDRPAKAGFLAA